MPFGVDALHAVASGLESEFLVEVKGGLLRRWVDIACSSSTSRELVGGRWETVGEERSWSAGCCAAGGLWGSEEVAGSSTSAVDVLVCADGGVGLVDLIGRHVEGRLLMSSECIEVNSSYMGT